MTNVLAWLKGVLQTILGSPTGRAALLLVALWVGGSALLAKACHPPDSPALTAAQAKIDTLNKVNAVLAADTARLADSARKVAVKVAATHAQYRVASDTVKARGDQLLVLVDSITKREKATADSTAAVAIDSAVHQYERSVDSLKAHADSALRSDSLQHVIDMSLVTDLRSQLSVKDGQLAAQRTIIAAIKPPGAVSRFLTTLRDGAIIAGTAYAGYRVGRGINIKL